MKNDPENPLDHRQALDIPLAAVLFTGQPFKNYDRNA